jgi:hypothetical protein
VVIDFLRLLFIHLIKFFLGRAQHLQRERHDLSTHLLALISIARNPTSFLPWPISVIGSSFHAFRDRGHVLIICSPRTRGKGGRHGLEWAPSTQRV